MKDFLLRRRNLLLLAVVLAAALMVPLAGVSSTDAVGKTIRRAHALLTGDFASIPGRPVYYFFVAVGMSLGGETIKAGYFEMFTGAEPPEMAVHFDFEAVIAEGGFRELGDPGTAQTYAFRHDENQKRTIERLLNTYGSHRRGLTRLITRTNLTALLRSPESI